MDGQFSNAIAEESNSDMSVSTDDEGTEQHNVGIELCEENGTDEGNGLSTEEPYLGMTFDNETAVWNYYTNYGKSKGFGVSRRSSRLGEDKKLKYLTLSCCRYSKGQSKSKNLLKPNPLSGTECKAKINAIRQPDGKFQLSAVILDHNHGLSPHKSRFYRCNRKLDLHVKRRLEINDRAGIRVNKNFNSFVVAAGGHENLTFGEKDCRNFLGKTRRLNLGNGDAEAVRDYFVKMQSDNPNFFNIMDLDEESRLRNVFWADARSRAVYESFSDVITFDTTYLTNKYDMPFACFVGVNHHGQSVLLGCALLSNEDTATFVWLFKAWLKCMSGRLPKAIITDQAGGIQNAVEIVFPESRYRWYLWHIMKKIPEKFGRYSAYEDIKVALGNAVYDSLTIEEFEVAWKNMVDRYNLSDNEWIQVMYSNRHRWVPAFVKDTFWAGMSTTQRSESMNSFFDGYVNSKTTLRQFVGQYENALRDKVEKENTADFHSFSASRPCVTHYDIEKQFQSVYTNSKFQEFQEELIHKMYCYSTFLNKEGAVEEYQVTEDMKIGDDRRKDVIYNIFLNEKELEVKCSCRRSEFRGILCRHVLCLLTQKKVKEVPSKYILERWKKNVKRKHNFIRCTYGGMDDTPVAKRFDMLCNSFYEVAEVGAMSDKSCNTLIEAIRTLQIQFSSNSGIENVKERHAQEVLPHDRSSKTIVSPVAVRSRGRPPILRKINTAERKSREKSARQKKAQKKQKENSDKDHSKEIIKDNVNMISLAPDHVNWDSVQHMGRQMFPVNGPEKSGTLQAYGSNLSFGAANFIQPMAHAMPSAHASTAVVVPPSHGGFTSLLLGVQENSVMVPTSTELHFGEGHMPTMYQG